MGTLVLILAGAIIGAFFGILAILRTQEEFVEQFAKYVRENNKKDLEETLETKYHKLQKTKWDYDLTIFENGGKPMPADAALSNSDDNVDEIAYWSIERESPSKAIDSKTGKIVNIRGILADVSASKIKAKDLVGYVKENYGGGDYIIYGCNYKSEQVNNRPLTIPSNIPSLDGNGNKFSIVPEKERVYQAFPVTKFSLGKSDMNNEKIDHWVFERVTPAYAYRNNSKVEITGVVAKISCDNLQAKDITDYMKEKIGGGTYFVYGCDSNGLQIASASIVIPMTYPTLDQNGEILDIQFEKSEKVKDLQDSLEDWIGAYRELETDFETLEDSLHETEGQSESHKEEIEHLKQKVAFCNNEIRICNNEIRILQRTNESILSENEKMHLNNVNLQKKLKDIENTLKIVSIDKEKMYSSNVTLRERLEKAERKANFDIYSYSEEVIISALDNAAVTEYTPKVSEESLAILKRMGGYYKEGKLSFYDRDKITDGAWDEAYSFVERHFKDKVMDMFS